MIHIIKSIGLLTVMILPWAALLLSARVISVDVLFGLSGPAFLTSLYYRKVFADFEPEQQQELNFEMTGE
jgi:hypothetical protein